MSEFVIQRQFVDFQGNNRIDEVVFGWNARTAKSALFSALREVEQVEPTKITCSNKFGIATATCSIGDDIYVATEMNNPFV